MACDRSDRQKEDISKDTQSAVPLPPIEVVVVDDDSLAAAIGREWRASGGEPLNIRRMIATDLKKRQAWNADVIVYPNSWMSELVSRRIIRPFEFAAADESDADERALPPVDLSDFFERTRNSEMQWGKRLYGVSLGSPQYVLLYRKDVFSTLSLSVPKTWSDYGELLSTLEDQSTEVRAILGTETSQPLSAEPLGVNWAAKTFLARAAAYSRNRSQYSCLFSIQDFDPQIANPPFVKALDELRSSHTVANDETPYTVAAAFADGKLATALAWPEAARSIGRDNVAGNKADKFPIGIASLPGATESFERMSGEWQSRNDAESPHVPLMGISGRCASIGRRTPDIERAYEFVLWLADSENGLRTTRRSRDTTIARFSQIGSLSAFLPPAFARSADVLSDVIVADQSRDLTLSVVRVPGHDRYMASLDIAIRESLRSPRSSKEILMGVAEQWVEITDEIGRKKQIAAYAESLGINR